MEQHSDIKNNNNNSDQHKKIHYDDVHHDTHKSHSFLEELLHHFPYAIFAAALSIIALTLLDTQDASHDRFNRLFHSFHFLHVLFASTGTVITYTMFAKKTNLLKTIAIGTISPIIFCIISDMIIPYISGIAMGVDMELHICFHEEMRNIWPFLLMGLINGMILKEHHSAALRVFSLGSHFTHILISSLASLFYMVSRGLSDWYPKMGYMFLFLVVAIVIPCTFSDVIIPMYFASKENK